VEYAETERGGIVTLITGTNVVAWAAGTGAMNSPSCELGE
jgi:hypothetical protein